MSSQAQCWAGLTGFKHVNFAPRNNRNFSGTKHVILEHQTLDHWWVLWKLNDRQVVLVKMRRRLIWSGTWRAAWPRWSIREVSAKQAGWLFVDLNHCRKYGFKHVLASSGVIDDWLQELFSSWLGHPSTLGMRPGLVRWLMILQGFSTGEAWWIQSLIASTIIHLWV